MAPSYESEVETENAREVPSIKSRQVWAVEEDVTLEAKGRRGVTKVVPECIGTVHAKRQE
jgi:hypothetical protein